MSGQAYEVRSITSHDAHEWLLRVHYAKRIPSISYAFGLFAGLELVGIVTYGVPSSAPLRRGVAGDEHIDLVLELNRLCFAEPVKNGPSMLVARSLKFLPQPSIVVSYADTAQGHVGYVYQACNFLYTGLSAKRTDWNVKGLEGMHGQSIADMTRNVTGSRSEYMRQEFGDDFYLSDRPRKHRYVIIAGNAADKRRLAAAIRYPVEPYPKGESKRYEITESPRKQQVMF